VHATEDAENVPVVADQLNRDVRVAGLVAETDALLS